MLMRGRTSARRRALLLGVLVALVAGLMVPAFAVDPGGVHFEGAYATDGYINKAEADAPDPGRPVTWTDPGGADHAHGRFADSANVTFAEPGSLCGPFGPFAPTGTGTDGHLNSVCMNHIRGLQGSPATAVETRWCVEWFDAADASLGPEVCTSIQVDTLVGSPFVTMDDTPFTAGKVSKPEADAGVPVAWDLSDDADNSVSVIVKNVGDPDPPGGDPCNYTPQPDVGGAGNYQPSCWATLDDGDVIATHAGADVAGNPIEASDTTVLDRAGSGPATDIAISPAPCINATQAAGTTSVTGTVPAAAPAVTTANVTLSSTGGGGPLATSVPTGATSFTANFANIGATLGDGQLTASVVLVDGDANPSAAASASNVRLDTVLAGSPTITAPAQGALVGGGQNQTYLVAGTSEPSATVEVWRTTPLGVPIERLGTATANAAGAWQLRSPRRPTGTEFIRARQADSCGNGFGPFTAVRAFDFDADVPTSNITGPPAGSVIMPGDPLVVTVDGSDADSGVLALEFHVYDLSQVDIRNFDPLHPSVNPNSPPEVIVGHHEVLQGNMTCALCGTLPPGSRNVTASVNLTSLPRGVYQIEIFAIDRANNRQIQPSVTRVEKTS